MYEPCRVTRVSDSSFLVNCGNLYSAGVPGTIDPGSDGTVVLRADILNAKVDNSKVSTLQVSLQNLSDPAPDFGPSGSHVAWFDVEVSPFSQILFDWIESPQTTINGTAYAG